MREILTSPYLFALVAVASVAAIIWSVRKPALFEERLPNDPPERWTVDHERPREWRPMMHDRCGGVAMYYDAARSYSPNDPIVASAFLHGDGRPTEPGDPIVCAACGSTIFVSLASSGGLKAIDRGTTR